MLFATSARTNHQGAATQSNTRCIKFNTRACKHVTCAHLQSAATMLSCKWQNDKLLTYMKDSARKTSQVRPWRSPASRPSHTQPIGAHACSPGTRGGATLGAHRALSHTDTVRQTMSGGARANSSPPRMIHTMARGACAASLVRHAATRALREPFAVEMP